jgi:hypothetical protein
VCARAATWKANFEIGSMATLTQHYIADDILFRPGQQHAGPWWQTVRERERERMLGINLFHARLRLDHVRAWSGCERE